MPITTTLPRTYLAACSGLLLIAAAGCADSTAEQRDAAQVQLAKASTTLAEASRPYAGPEEAESVARNLNDAISQLNAITGGIAGQQAAVSVLTAQARRELAAVDIAAAKHIESDNRVGRHVIDGMITAAARLDALAGALESTDVGEEQSRLARDRRDAAEAMRIASQQIAELDGPIAELVSANRQATDEVARLRREANDKRREANDLGLAAGLEAYEQAIALDREADRLENEIAERELVLRYDLEPRHAIATRQAEALTAVLEAIDDAGSSMDAVVEGANADAATIREHFGELYAEIESSLDAIEQQMTSALADHYDRAQRNLETATSKARAAANQERQGEFADSARLEAARAQLELADISATRARGLAHHIELLAGLRNVPGLAGMRGADPGEMTRAFEDARGQATGAYNQAIELLGQVRTRTAQNDLDALQRLLNDALATLGGGAPASSPPAAATGGSAPEAGGNGGAGTQGMPGEG